MHIKEMSQENDELKEYIKRLEVKKDNNYRIE